MLTDILQNFDIQISNVWLAAGIDGVFIFTLFFFVRFLLKKLEGRWLVRFKGRPHLPDILRIGFRLTRRLLIVTAFYSLSQSVPSHKKYDVLLLDASFVLGVYFILISIFDIADGILKSVFKSA